MAKIIETQKEIQQQLASLQKRYLRLILQDTALARLLRIIRDRQSQILQIAHPAGRLISGKTTTTLGDNPAIVKIINMLSWQSISGRSCKTQITFEVSHNEEYLTRLDAISIDAVDLEERPFPPFFSTALARHAMLHYCGDLLAKYIGVPPSTLINIINRDIPVKFMLSSMLLSLANNP